MAESMNEQRFVRSGPGVVRCKVETSKNRTAGETLREQERGRMLR